VPAGEVDVVLRPDQAAADSRMELGTYWGEEIVVPGVIVNAPYEAAFDRDASLAKAVERAVTLSDVSDNSHDKTRRFSATLRVNGSPVTMAYRIEVRAGEWIGVERHDDLRASFGDNTGYTGGSFPLPPAGEAGDVVDVWLIPDSAWEQFADEGDPLPWGFPLVFEGVRVPPAGEAFEPRHPRAVVASGEAE
jgi:hypothetical protein